MLSLTSYLSNVGTDTLPNEGHEDLLARPEAAAGDPLVQGSWTQDIPLIASHQASHILQPSASASPGASGEAATGVQLAQGGRVGVANRPPRHRRGGYFAFIMNPVVSKSPTPIEQNEGKNKNN